MSIQTFIFSLLIVFLSVSATVAGHYKTKAAQTQTALTELKTKYDDNQKMLLLYQQQTTKLNQQLAAANTQAEDRKQLLQEVLVYEKNQKWRDTPVPDDVVRLFEQRKQNGTNKADLPTNDRMPKH